MPLDVPEQDAIGRVREIVERYDGLIRHADLSNLTEAEWNRLRELALGSFLLADVALPLDHEVEDGLAHDDLAEKWQIDGDRFLRTIRAMSFAQRLAIVERLEAERV